MLARSFQLVKWASRILNETVLQFPAVLHSLETE